MHSSAESFIRAVTDFIFVSDPPEAADAIFVPGSAHPEHAVHAAELYSAGYAQLIIPSGKYAIGSDGFPGEWETEADYLTDVLLRHGVPRDAILAERDATYTWENAQLSRALTDARGIEIRTAILCCRCWHARRALLYYQTAYPQTAWLVCPAQIEGYRSDDWWKSKAGRSRILGEVARLGGQIGEVFESMLKEELEDDRA